MTPLSFNVLRALADGEFHSGAALALSFGVSRGTIWNAVAALEAAGLTVYRIRGRGYRLTAPVSLLEPQAVAAHAGAAADRVSFEILDVVDSTNTALLRGAGEKRPGTVLAAEWQTAGRGRMGRRWQSKIGEGLAFSLLHRFDLGAGALAGLSLIVGVAIARALEQIGARDIGLKWPNDVLWRDRKLAGVLIEMHGDALGPSTVVIGIGLNVALPPESRALIDQPVVDMSEVCNVADRSRILGTLLAELVPALDRFGRDGFRPFTVEWLGRHVYQDQPLVLQRPDGHRVRGIARGIADDGALLVEHDGAVRAYHSGEISVRRAQRVPTVTSTRSAA